MANERVLIDGDLTWNSDEHGHQLFHADGGSLGYLPKSFTEEQILAAAQLANAWYAAGLNDGHHRALANLHAAFGIKPAGAN